MAHLPQDPGLIKAYRQGEDLHNYVGLKMSSVDIDEVTPGLRCRVEAVSYGLAYDLSAFSLAQRLDIPQHKAEKLMEDCFERFDSMHDCLHKVVGQVRKGGFAAAVSDRHCCLPEFNTDNRITRSNAKRTALGSPTQGSTADIVKITMLQAGDALRRGRLRSHVLLRVHDELVVEVTDRGEAAIKGLLYREVGPATELLVPLDASIGVGMSWDTATHW